MEGIPMFFAWIQPAILGGFILQGGLTLFVWLNLRANESKDQADPQGTEPNC